MPAIMVKRRDGSLEPVQEDKINLVIQRACQGLDKVSWSDVALGCQVSWYSGISTEEIDESVIMSARSLIEQHPQYSFVAARLLLYVLYQRVFGPEVARSQDVQGLYVANFKDYLQKGVDAEMLDAQLLNYDLDRLGEALVADRDMQFQYQGIQILKDRYLIQDRSHTIIELPQWMWMRVAMGLALNEPDLALNEPDKQAKTREDRAIEFYNIYSQFRYISSTPTLFSSGTNHPQLSSCFLNTTEDSLEGIFKVYTDNARLSKWAGGLGTDWTSVRATNANIKGTNGKSQGLIPWLKIDNDVAIAVNQGGKRKGAHCAYLETWHLDIEEFLELRKNVGDERRRTHDINTANWIPDLFMKRVMEDKEWTLFTPDQVPELHDLYGKQFEVAYEQREAEFDQGLLLGKRIEAKALWRKMLSMLFETGHPWITFKDPCNLRSPQDHVGVVHSSNLCTEITLNTSASETAVCNLGSINLSAHVTDGKLDEEKLKETVKTAVRMLDNVIDINFYPTMESEKANLQHRAIGLGTMGYQDMLYQLNLPFNSDEHIEFADELFEKISYYAIATSADLAEEKGAYPSFKGSKWDRGIFPVDTVDMLENERGVPIECNRTKRLDWDSLKARVAKVGMRNSNVMAIAPTATIANIIGVMPSIEPTFRNLFVSSNLSGEFTVINHWLVSDLEARNMWNREMADALKAVDGQLHLLDHIPDDLVRKYPDIFAIDQKWLVEGCSVRGKWIDQSQSLNLFVSKPSGKELNDLYTNAWKKGLKTTYYLRTLGASQVEKSTVDQSKYGRTHKRGQNVTPINENIPLTPPMTDPGVACSILNGDDCEACQ